MDTTLISVVLLLTSAGQGWCQPEVEGNNADDLYLYLDRDAVVHIPTFKQQPCTTNPGGKPKFEPTARSGAVVGYKGQDSLMLCGGYQLYGCQVWTETGWQDVEGDFKRAHAASSKLPDGKWLVTGGFGTTANPNLWTTQIYSEYDGWSDFVPLPWSLTGHCQVTVGRDVYVIGGQAWQDKSGGYRNVPSDHEGKYLSTLVLKDKSWGRLPYDLSREYNYHACGVLGSWIYIVGGSKKGAMIDSQRGTTIGGEETSVEIFNTDKPEAGWVAGPELPDPVKDNRIQAVVHDNTLYLVSGSVREGPVTKVYKIRKGDQNWEVVQGVNISQNPISNYNKPYWPPYNRPVFPAPLLTKNILHCSKPVISSGHSCNILNTVLVILLAIQTITTQL